MSNKEKLPIIKILFLLISIMWVLGSCSSGAGSAGDSEEETSSSQGTAVTDQTVKLKPLASVTNDASPLLQWTSVSIDDSFNGYEIQVATNTTFTNIVSTSYSHFATYELPPLKEDGKYYIRVRVRSTGLSSGAWSTPISFVLDTTSPTITIAKPAIIKNSFTKVLATSNDSSDSTDEVASDNDQNNNNSTQEDDPAVYPSEIDKDARFILMGQKITIRWGVDDEYLSNSANISFDYSYDSITWGKVASMMASDYNYAGEFSWTPDIVEEVDYILLRAQYSDSLGNKAVYITDIIFQYYDEDALEPETVLLATPSATPAWDITEYTFQVQQTNDPFCPVADDGDSSKCFYPVFEYKLKTTEDYKSILADDGEIVFKYLPSGQYDFTIRMVTLAGIVDPTPETFSFVVDKEPPGWVDDFGLTLKNSLNGLEGYINSTDVLAEIGSAYGYEFDQICLTEKNLVDRDDSCWQATPEETTITHTFDDINAQQKKLYLFLKDEAQNISESVSASVVVDVDPPPEVIAQVFDYDSNPERSTYANNYSLKLRIPDISCPSDFETIFVRATLAATSVIKPTVTEINGGTLLPNSQRVACSSSAVILTDIISGLVPEGTVGPEDLRIHFWSMDKVGNLSEKTFVEIQYYTGGNYFNITLNDGVRPTAASGFNIKIEKSDSDGVVLTDFSEDVDIAFSWKNGVASRIGSVASVVLGGGSTSTYSFSDGTWTSTGEAFILYNIVRGAVSEADKTVLQVDATFEDQSQATYYSNSFTLGGGAIDHIEIVNDNDDAAEEITGFTLTIGESKTLYASLYDSYGNWIEQVFVTWKAIGFFDMYDFTYIKGTETTFIPSVTGTGGSIEAKYTYTDSEENQVNLTDSVTGIAVTE